jgi:hypothetical protein
MGSPPGFGWVRVARAPVFSASFWWGPCCSSTCVLRQVLVGSVLLEHLCFPPVFGNWRRTQVLEQHGPHQNLAENAGARATRTPPKPGGEHRCSSNTDPTKNWRRTQVLEQHGSHQNLAKKCSPPGFGGVRVARAPVFSPSFWWGPCCSSTCVLRQVLVGSVLLEHLCSRLHRSLAENTGARATRTPPNPGGEHRCSSNTDPTKTGRRTQVLEQHGPHQKLRENTCARATRTPPKTGGEHRCSSNTDPTKI